VQINPRIDWTFAKALRAFVRADPDVIMVGEIRDEETAKTAIEASLTGHLVLSTLHTNSAPETVTRLLDMGMDPFNFADSLLAVLAQRLVRRLCTHCVVGRPASPEKVERAAGRLHARILRPRRKPGDSEAVRDDWLHRYGRDGQAAGLRSAGCKHCGNTGFKGRVGIHELMVISKNLRRLVQGGARAEELQAAALQEGMRTLRQDGIEKVLAGQDHHRGSPRDQQRVSGLRDERAGRARRTRQATPRPAGLRWRAWQTGTPGRGPHPTHEMRRPLAGLRRLPPPP
jgi:type II secretory ATPase GspE/PulE/Tfp pilus assembly ATPase PilB-like protein